MTEPARQALSLWQWWASLIADGIKTSETRTWACPPSLIGRRLNIHATKRPPKLHEMIAIISAAPQGMLDGFAFTDPPLGAIVATVTVRDCGRVGQRRDAEGDLSGEALVRVPGDADYWHPMDGLGDYSLGRYVWGFTDVVKWRTPVPARGMQGIWNVPTCSECDAPLAADNVLVAGLCVPRCRNEKGNIR